MTTKKHSDLVAHVARVEGQLAAVRAALEADDCSKVARTLFAASRSLGSLRATCIDTFLRERVYPHALVKDKQLLEDVHALMKA